MSRDLGSGGSKLLSVFGFMPFSFVHRSKCSTHFVYIEFVIYLNYLLFKEMVNKYFDFLDLHFLQIYFARRWSTFCYNLGPTHSIIPIKENASTYMKGRKVQLICLKYRQWDISARFGSRHIMELRYFTHFGRI